MENNGKNKRDAAWIQKAMQDLEKKLGGEAAANLKNLSNPKDLERLVSKLSESDMARLEQLLRDPKQVGQLLTQDNTRKLKKILEE